MRRLHMRAATILAGAALGLLLPPRPSSADDRYVWVLRSVEANPSAKPRSFDAGVTPGYYSPRFAGSHEEHLADEKQVGLRKKWVDRERLDYDVALTATLPSPKQVLVPGDTVRFEVGFSKSGTVNSGNPGIVFLMAASAGTLTGPPDVGYFPYAPGHDGATAAVWNFQVPPATEGVLTIDASLKDLAAARVRWTYRAEYRDGSESVDDWEDLLPDWLRPKSDSGIRSRGVVIEPRGDVEVYKAAFRRWIGPIRSDTEIHENDRVRTGHDGTCRVVFTNRAGAQDTVTVGVDTLLEVPGRDRPPLSLAAELVLGVIKIKSALLGDQRAPPESPFIVRTATVMAGSRGTEYVVSVAQDKTTRVLVREGRVGVFAIGPRVLTEVGPGRKVELSPAGDVASARMEAEEYDARLRSGGLLEAPAAEVGRRYDVPELPADVTGLRLYEGPSESVPLDARAYSTRFPRAQVRNVWWQLDLAYPRRERPAAFALKGLFYNPDGSFRAETTIDGRLDVGWSSSQHTIGLGYPEPGRWPPGRYRVEVLVNGRKVAETNFEIDP